MSVLTGAHAAFFSVIRSVRERLTRCPALGSRYTLRHDEYS